jgi:predicted O-methyltransferase YrrM
MTRVRGTENIGGMMRRYTVLLDYVRDLQPKHVVEIGTWNGKRASEFMAVSNCYYTGFDVFEEGDQALDSKELNVKRHEEMVEVAKKLETVGVNRFMLVRGDTNKTLWETEVEPFDFAFIDGGHSLATIQNDFNWVYENIEEGGTIILDDYYIPEVDGFGCNFLEEMGEVIDTGDRYINGRVCLLKVVK